MIESLIQVVDSCTSNKYCSDKFLCITEVVECIVIAYIQDVELWTMLASDLIYTVCSLLHKAMVISLIIVVH